MIAPVDLTSLSAPAQKMAAASAPLKLQEMAAKGVAPGLKPGEMVTLLVHFYTASERPTVKEASEKTLNALPEPLLQGALGADLPATVIDVLAAIFAARIDVLDRLLGMPRVSPDTVDSLAQHGSEEVTELVAVNEDRLLKNPQIIERLYLNKRTRMSTADRLIDLAVRNGITLNGIAAFKEAALAIQDELIPMASEERSPDDELFTETSELAEQLQKESTEEEDTHEETPEGEEVVKDKYLPLYQRIANMTVSQKIRRAMLGSKEERMLLVRDTNRLVAAAVVRSPMMQENEAALISRNRNVSEDVLRILATIPAWSKAYGVKKNLVENAKTPIMISQRLVPMLREYDLKQIAKSKHITGAVKEAARRHLERRKT
ncbi:MAG: hypothetical protein ABJE95_23830 [Byssovorax sp.]